MGKIKLLIANRRFRMALVSLGVTILASFGYTVSPEVQAAVDVLLTAWFGVGL